MHQRPCSHCGTGPSRILPRTSKPFQALQQGLSNSKASTPLTLTRLPSRPRWNEAIFPALPNKEQNGDARNSHIATLNLPGRHARVEAEAFTRSKSPQRLRGAKVNTKPTPPHCQTLKQGSVYFDTSFQTHPTVPPKQTWTSTTFRKGEHVPTTHLQPRGPHNHHALPPLPILPFSSPARTVRIQHRAPHRHD